MIRKISCTLLLVLLSFFVASNVAATLISYEFSGSLYDIIEYQSYTHVNQYALSGDFVTVDDTFTGRFTYETSTNAFSNDGTRSYYNSALQDFEVTVNHYTFSNSGNRMKSLSIYNNYQLASVDPPTDMFAIRDSYFSDEYFESGSLSLIDRTASFTDNLLIPENLDLSSFANRNQFKIHFTDRVTEESFSIEGTLETLSPLNAAPEPSTVILFGMGLLSFAWFRKDE